MTCNLKKASPEVKRAKRLKRRLKAKAHAAYLVKLSGERKMAQLARERYGKPTRKTNKKGAAVIARTPYQYDEIPF